MVVELYQQLRLLVKKLYGFQQLLCIQILQVAAEAAQVELSNGPEIKVLDFDKTSDEFAQFAVAFPKSWNEGTVTFQAFFTATSTDTGTTAFVLQGVALADNGDLNTAFGTAVGPTAKAHSGTSNDLDVTAESGAVTIAGSPGVG